jgi:hypothetical protein
MIFQIFLFYFFIFQVEKHSIPDISKQKRGNTKKNEMLKKNLKQIEQTKFVIQF